MSAVGALERVTQNRIVELFKNQLGYKYLGDWKDKDNKNIEINLLKSFLQKNNYSDKLIERALRELDKATAIGSGRSLYDANKDVYSLLRYGIKVKDGVGEKNETVWLIDWANPEKNDFAIAEEVTVKGDNDKRPDLVLYINGIAICVIELKRSTKGVSEGIRQNILNQNKECIRHFFTTIQLLMAGSDTGGLRYGTIEISEKYYLEWKEEGGIGDYKLDRHLSLICDKKRLLELIHDFIVFDAGIKKTCRHNQYFGVKAAQNSINRRQGGIIWHTQGSGKSLTMVWLTKWIRENKKNARVLIITDRRELDEQIEKVYHGVNENIYRTTSGEDLIHSLNASEPWLICSLIHKFGSSDNNDLADKDVDKFVAEIQKYSRSNFNAKGDIYVFVDECHRTQAGKLHTAMKKLLPHALFIGFTGTPILKKDKQTSIEIFGPYIHTYKFDEAVKDKVVLDLLYEARDINQIVIAPDKIDAWFKGKTSGLTDFARAQLKKRWGTMQKVLSSQSRLEKIVTDILFDMEMRPRLANGRGNAILVAGSIYQACKFYEIFAKTELAGKCAIVTSYKPSLQSIKDEYSGEGYTDKLNQYNIYKKMLSDFFEQPEDQSVNRIDEFEKKVKEKFIKEPGQMRLLIVVDKLLTGFDAPSATYLYIDKKMQDHTLFQAICRVNRLYGEGKEYGYIIDYRDLFNCLESSIRDYTSGAFDNYDKEDVTGLIKDRFTTLKQRIDEARETLKALCENVSEPKDTAAYIKYFCTEDKQSIRFALYKAINAFIRAYAALANEMPQAGYSAAEIAEIKNDVKHYELLLQEIKIASGDYIDMKLYDPAMLHLINSYIQADESRTISDFNDMSLIHLIVELGEGAIESLPKKIRNSEELTAETIENNMRRLIIDESEVNPKYYEEMSKLLEELIKERKDQAIKYKEYMQKIKNLAAKLVRTETNSAYPKSLASPAKRALYDNLGKDEQLALKVDNLVRTTKKDNFLGNKAKEREIKLAITEVVTTAGYDVEHIFELVKKQQEYLT
ncbi:type I restriction endonuclease subunit R [Bartonella sp. DGB1]|uniref:type I restriction endonuclease subunit R n=1 Tax=Bartonella sp. DGB1 TaxID=3239807 RepID=UPI0035233161